MPYKDVAKRKAYHLKYDRLYHLKNKPRIQIRKKAYQAKHKDAYKARNLKKNYNISLDEYNKLFHSQKGRCAICDKHQSEFLRASAVDHNHTTNEVRALLCNNCNSMLGYSKEDPQNLINGAKYLKKYKS